MIDVLQGVVALVVGATAARVRGIALGLLLYQLLGVMQQNLV
uniref:Uncharacterized protein n=1 Tax=Anguilla anguilla TaxID=7936 RepID=A0A0E9WFY3_ANGAN